MTRAFTTPGEQAGPQPLSPAQEGLWFMPRLAPLSTAYHLARVTRHYEPPQGELEEVIARIWSDVLGIEQIERVSRRDNFFELGGDSIFSLQVRRRISLQPSVEVEVEVELEAFSAVVSAARESAASGQEQGQDRLADDMQSILSELKQ